MNVEIEDLHVGYASRDVVAGVRLMAADGEIAGLVGPNGSGKSTVLRTVYRHLRPTAGRVLLAGDDLRTLTPGQTARRVAALPQERGSDFELTVREVVTMGRTPYKRAFAGDDRTDRERVAGALAAVGMAGQGARRFSALSGASANARCWHGPSPRTLRCWYWTSPPTTSTYGTRSSCSRCCGRSAVRR